MEAEKGYINKQEMRLNLRSYLALSNIDQQLDRGQVLWKWVSILQKLQERNTRRPNVSADAILFSTDSLRLCGR